MAVVAGEYEAAIKGYQWLTGHIPADQDGVRVVDGDVDRPHQVEGRTGPVINIGLKLGGLETQKQLSDKVIDIDSHER